MKASLVRSVVPAVALSVCLAACATGPSTREELCAKFDDLGKSVLNANGIFDNAVFRNAKSLGGLADRYEQADLSRDASRLKEIGGSDSTNGAELMDATSGISGVCGHPLALNLFGQ